MSKFLILFLFLVHFVGFSQTDYSDSWEDFYAYNNVKSFVKVDDVIYALADNAVFTYNLTSGDLKKLSSVQGLSGETTTAIYYNKTFKRLVIGYDTGLVEVVDDDGTITIAQDIVNFNQSGEKRINHISSFNNTLYLSTPFAIVAFDIERLEFGDTFFIGNNSSAVIVNKTQVINGVIYAVTNSGIFKADVSSNALIDFNNWQQLFAGRRFTNISFLNTIYVVENTKVFTFDGTNLNLALDVGATIKDVTASATHLSITLDKQAIIYNVNLAQTQTFTPSDAFNFNLSSAYFENNTAYLATAAFGILIATATNPNNYVAVYPEGPLENDVFSIAAHNNSLWVVYGGYDGTFSPVSRRKGFSHYNGDNWINTPYNPSLPSDLSHITIDKNEENKVYISALGISSDVTTMPTGGVLVVENNQVVTTYNHTNSALTPIVVSLPNINIRVSSTALDKNNNLWATNYETEEELVTLSNSGQWSSVNLSSVRTNSTPGLTEITLDNSNTKWIGSRSNGVYAFNEAGNRKKALVTTANAGNLPDLNVRTIAADASNNVWLGTKSGLVVYRNASGVFDDDAPNAVPIVINANADGFGDRLLGDQTINSIVVDGADNKWFGTDTGGVIYTNPSGQNTIANFNKSNSPLPSNRILKIAVDNTSGKVYFATNKGIVAYNSSVAPFGDVLGDVYAYPNPVLSRHETVTITGRNGTSLPRRTNVKIIDVAGNLVYETNVVEGQQLQGGKVVWDKRNLAGKKVASGVYIALLSNDDGAETSFVKIAIVN